MKYFASVALAGLACATTDPANHWAVIMAGSNTYSNYRHQADSHHAVKLMLENGIPRDQIIHLAYNDVANNYYNPYPGQLFNKPTNRFTPGVNVYDESEIDYTGTEVNKANFFAVLTGDAENATGPVLKSDENSHVFVYFVDHGGVGLICTPQGSQDWIYADELDATLQTMYDNNMYKELTFYLEACESGSMFPGLAADNRNIYAMTASNASQSSWGAYCGSEAKVKGVNIGSCLGDLFSINWMEDTEANDVTVETLLEQQGTVTELTTKSPVQTFGTTEFLWEAIGDFQGDYTEEDTYQHLMEEKYYYLNKVLFGEQERGSKEHVDSRDHKLHMLTQRVMNLGTKEALEELQAEIDHRRHVDGLFEILSAVPSNNGNVQDYDCLREMVGAVEELCGVWSDYSLKYVGKLADTCDSQPGEKINEYIQKMRTYCQAY